jgi:hypothetical protein
MKRHKDSWIIIVIVWGGIAAMFWYASGIAAVLR